MDALTCHLYVFLSIWSDEIALYPPPPLPFPTPWIVFAFRPEREKEKFVFCLKKKAHHDPSCTNGTRLGSLPPPFFVAYKNRQSVDQMRRHTFKKKIDAGTRGGHCLFNQNDRTSCGLYGVSLYHPLFVTFWSFMY
jgi:hypothetical protein